jgi:hypothetical protein
LATELSIAGWYEITVAFFLRCLTGPDFFDYLILTLPAPFQVGQLIDMMTLPLYISQTLLGL